MRLSTVRIFQMWQTCLLQFWCFLLWSFSEAFVLFYLWDQRMHGVNRAPTLSSYFTPLTCPSSCNRHLFPISTSFSKYEIWHCPILISLPPKGSYSCHIWWSCCTGGTVETFCKSEWQHSEYSGGQYIPIGGLAYHVTAPSRWLCSFSIIPVLFLLCWCVDLSSFD